MKRVFIIHGWTGKPNQHWTSWLAAHLESKGFSVFQPEMPESDHPRMEAWVSHLKEEVGISDQETYFVGHSIGCATILRYLEKYNEKIGGAVLVAPWITLNPESFAAPEDKEVVDEWTEGGFNWAKLKTLCPHFISLLSKDDPDVPFEENKPVFENLGVLIVAENKGHFTEGEGVTDLPQALEAILKLANEN